MREEMLVKTKLDIALDVDVANLTSKDFGLTKGQLQESENTFRDKPA